MTTKTSNPAAHAREAADSYLADLIAAIQTAGHREQLDLDDLNANLTAVFVAAGKDPSPVLDAAERVAERFGYSNERHGTSTAARHVTVSYVPEVARVIDEALADGDRTDLDTARAEVNELHDELDDALAQLEDAVQRADVAAVMRLRPEVEVGLPGRLEQAKLRVLDAEIAMAEAAEEPARRRVGERQAAQQKAAAAVQQVEEELAGLRDVLQTATVQLATEQRVVDGHRSTMTRLRKDRAALAEKHRAEVTKRMRRLAGLPEPAPERPTPAPRPVPTTQWLSMSYTERAIQDIDRGAGAKTSDEDFPPAPEDVDEAEVVFLGSVREVGDLTPRVVSR